MLDSPLTGSISTKNQSLPSLASESIETMKKAHHLVLGIKGLKITLEIRLHQTVNEKVIENIREKNTVT